MSRRTWIPFYQALCQGDKRGLPRGVRFVYLELCLLARDTGGIIKLPPGFRSDADAVHDLIGGDRKEIRDALQLLQTPFSVQDRAMISLEGELRSRVIVILASESWTLCGNVALRQQRFRTRQKQEHQTLSPPKALRMALPENAESVTPSVTQIREEKRREEERDLSLDLRNQDPKDHKHTSTRAALVGSTEPPSAVESKVENQTRSTQPTLPTLQDLQPSDGPSAPARQVYDHWVSGWRKHIGGSRPPKFDAKRRAKVLARIREGFSASDLCLAVDGLWKSPFHMGENSSNKRFVDLELVCRDAKHVEDFMGLHAGSRPAAPSREPIVEYGPPAPPPPGLLARIAELSRPRNPILRELDDLEAAAVAQ
jgi:hypothetical protein